MARSMDWTLDDNMVDGLFFCATLTDRRGGHTPFVQAGAETSDTGAEAVKPDTHYSWQSDARRVGGVSGMKVYEVSWYFPITLHSISHPPRSATPVPSPRGSFGGLTPLKQSYSTPKLKDETL